MGIGLTAVNLDQKNSDVEESRTASALTLSIGAVIKPSERANIGLFLGWDLLGVNDSEINWEYDRKAWLGIGINISFNEIKTNKPPTKKQQP